MEANGLFIDSTETWSSYMIHHPLFIMLKISRSPLEVKMDGKVKVKGQSQMEVIIKSNSSSGSN